MASIVTACRHSARVTKRCVRVQRAQIRDLSNSYPQWAASNFVMPAMSPTMTEGNIASWKVKEGDSFSTGDVLLEIETDKAQMDVEAQDDGVMAKIMQQDGAKGVKVGKRIAVLAEPGDDLSSLSIPSEEPSSETPASKPSSSSSKDDSAQQAQKQQDEPSKEPSGPQETTHPPDHHASETPSQPQKYPLYPSVQYLLHQKGIPLADADKIPASGPMGRLLKGDVLSYLGTISRSYSSDLSARLDKLSHLDLSNIKPAAPKRPTGTPASDQGKSAAKADKAAAAPATQIAVPISLAAVFATQKRIKESLDLNLPLSTFIARASEIANENLPRAKGAAVSSEELFDAVLGLDGGKRKSMSRGRYRPMITALPPGGSVMTPAAPRATKKVDVIDVLTGAKPQPKAGLAARRRSIPGAMGVGGAENVFSLSVAEGEEKRARTYLERVKTVLEKEPGRCVL